jgi:hypothetical protein
MKTIDFLLVFMACEDDKRKELELYRTWLECMAVDNSLRTRNYLTTNCLLDPEDNAWECLWQTGTDRELTAAIGIDRRTFVDLLDVFRDHYEVKSGPGRRGRPISCAFMPHSPCCLLFTAILQARIPFA